MLTEISVRNTAESCRKPQLLRLEAPYHRGTSNMWGNAPGLPQSVAISGTPLGKPKLAYLPFDPHFIPTPGKWTIDIWIQK